MFALVEVTVRVGESDAGDDETRGKTAAAAVQTVLAHNHSTLRTLGLEIVSVDAMETISE